MKSSSRLTDEILPLLDLLRSSLGELRGGGEAAEAKVRRLARSIMSTLARESVVFFSATLMVNEFEGAPTRNGMALGLLTCF